MRICTVQLVFFSQHSTFNDAEVSECMQNFDGSMNDSTFCELDEPITQDDIRKASKKLNSNKACSLDTLIKEYFKENIDILVNLLEILFNYILNKGTFLKQWSKGVIIPINKKGDNREPSNYGGITLVSCFGKLFTMILNELFKAWAATNNIISDAQVGFKADHSTVDAIFILESLVNKAIQDRKKSHCSFIDLKRAFDSVFRSALWYKLIKTDWKLFQTIRAIYADVNLVSET